MDNCLGCDSNAGCAAYCRTCGPAPTINSSTRKHRKRAVRHRCPSRVTITQVLKEPGRLLASGLLHLSACVSNPRFRTKSRRSVAVCTMGGCATSGAHAREDGVYSFLYAKQMRRGAEGSIFQFAKPTSMPLPPARDPCREEPTILVFGDSHSHAMHVAVQARLGEGRSVSLSVFRQRKEKNGRTVGNISFNAFLDRISRLRRTDIVLSAMGGNWHALLGTVQHPQPFDFFSPGHRAESPEEVQIVPYQALVAHFSKRIAKGVGRRLKILHNATPARVFHLIPPPPKRDNSFLAQHHEKLFANYGITTLGVSPPQLRLKFWRLHSRVLREFCRKRHIGVLMPPPETMLDGFLRPEFYAADTTHANWRYGELVLRRVEAQFLEHHDSLK